MTTELFKSFATYSEAYELYSDIVCGREKDRKNPTIVLSPQPTFVNGGGGSAGGGTVVISKNEDVFRVYFEQVLH